MRIYFAHHSWNLIMLNFENAGKKATNLSLNVKVLEAAREMGLNLSQTVDTLLADEIKRRYWAKWNEDNKEAIAAYNDRVAKYGLPLAKYRSWGKSLGDGRVGLENGAL
jgi:antitoxin CcdA